MKLWGRLLCALGFHQWNAGRWKLWCRRDGCFAERAIEEDENDFE